MVEGVAQSVPGQKKIQKANKSLQERKNGKVKTKDKLKITERENRYLDVYKEFEKSVPMRRKKADFPSKASTVELKKVEKKNQKKKGSDGGAEVS